MLLKKSKKQKQKKSRNWVKWVIAVLTVGLMAVGYVLGVQVDRFIEESKYKLTVSTEATDTLNLRDRVLTKFFELRIEHPYIVYAQAIVESNNFTSSIFLENNNMFGMKMPQNRLTTAIGIRKGHAIYSTWEDCIIDYALYQSRYLQGLTEDEYFNKLKRSYAEDTLYISKIRQMKSRLLKGK